MSWLSAADTDTLDALSIETGLLCDPEQDRTVQSDAEDADINKLVSRFGLTVDDPARYDLVPFGQFDGPADYHGTLQAVLDAKAAFAELPAKLRSRFENDPAQLLAFLADPENRTEAAELGLLTPEATEAILRKPGKGDPSSAPAPDPSGTTTAPEPSK